MTGSRLQVGERAIKSAIRANQRDRVLREAAEILLEQDVIAAGSKLGREAIFHAKDLGIPGEVGDVAEHLLVMGDEEAIAIDRPGIGVERIGLAVEPVALGMISVDLVFQRDVVGE